LSYLTEGERERERERGGGGSFLLYFATMYFDLVIYLILFLLQNSVELVLLTSKTYIYLSAPAVSLTNTYIFSMAAAQN